MEALGKLPLSADVVFRKLFEDLDLLAGLLNALLGLEGGGRLRRLSLMPLTLSGELHGDKEVIFDLRAEAEDGRHLHIEVQVRNQPDYPERMAYYLCGMFHGLLAAGQGYHELPPLVSLHLLYFDLLPDEPRYAQHHHVFELLARGHGYRLTDRLQLHVIEMGKLREQGPLDRAGRWLYFLKHGHEMTPGQVAALGDPQLSTAEKRLQMISQDRLLRIQHEQRRKAEIDAAAGLRDSYLAGERQGLDEGKRLAMRQGILDLCQAFGIDLGTEQRALIDAATLPALEALREHILSHRAWPPA